MDFNSLRDQVSNLTMYDIKAGVRKVQNAVMNYTEMEAKVREATNNEPWGASSSLMQEIANGTHSYHLLNEIMPMIYKRFTDKSAEEWRQIYKALQLLEFLVKNGSEQVIDDARSHLSLLRMLRQFHYIDPNGKDQGVNVRNRAQELAKLLNDVEQIRAERKKARANRNKFRGVEGGMGISGGFSSGSRFGGFGSDEAGGWGGYSGGVYGDGGGFGGHTSDYQDSGRRSERFEEYDEYDEGAVAPSGRRSSPPPRAGTLTSTASRREKKASETPKKQEPEPDLLGGDEPTPATTTTSVSTSNGKARASDAFAADDDDFDDFQSAPSSTTAPVPPPSSISTILPAPTPTSTGAPSSTTQFAAPKPLSSAQPDLSSLTSFQSITPSPAPSSTSNLSSPPLTQPPLQVQPQQQQAPAKPAPTNYQPKGPNYFTSIQVQSPPTSTAGSNPATPFSPGATKPAAKSTSSGGGGGGGDAFGNLWSTASAGAGIKKTTSASSGPNLAAMAKEKASAGIWGTGAVASPATMNQSTNMGTQRPGMPASRPTAPAPAPAPQQQQQSLGGGLDDLLG